MEVTAAACLFGVLAGFAMLFQLALALGAPWGEWAMGAKYPGRWPAMLRVGATVQMMLLGLTAVVVLTRAGLILECCVALSQTAIWFVLAVLALSAMMNAITPSRKEKRLWAPVTTVMCLCAGVVALS